MKCFVVKAAAAMAVACVVGAAAPQASAATVKFTVSGAFSQGSNASAQILNSGGKVQVGDGSITFTPIAGLHEVNADKLGHVFGTFSWDTPDLNQDQTNDFSGVQFTLTIAQSVPAVDSGSVISTLTGTLYREVPPGGQYNGANVVISFGGNFIQLPGSANLALPTVTYTPANVTLSSHVTGSGNSGDGSASLLGAITYADAQATPTPIPLPASAWMGGALLSGLAGAGILRRQRRVA